MSGLFAGKTALVTGASKGLGKAMAVALSFLSWLAFTVAVIGDDSSKSKIAPAVPDAVKAPVTEKLSFVADAKGVQIYECRLKKDSTTEYEWVFKAPEADLLDEHGATIGRHYAGPTWEAADGSKVVGEIKGREPSTAPSAIP